MALLQALLHDDWPLILVALYLAKARGYTVDDLVVNRALNSLEAARTNEGTYAALAIERLPASERNMWRDELRRLVWETREADGGWNDRIFPRSKSYGSAMSLLAVTAPSRAPLPGW